MRTHTVGRRPATRILICAGGVLTLAGLVSGVLAWCWTQAACLLCCEGRCGCRPATRRARCGGCWLRGGWSTPSRGVPDRCRASGGTGSLAYALAAVFSLALLCWATWKVYRRVRALARRLAAGQGAAHRSRGAPCDRGWVRQRTWAAPADLRRLWVPGPSAGRPYLGVIGRRAGARCSPLSSRCSRWSSRRRAPASPAASSCRGCSITTGPRSCSRPSATSTRRPSPHRRGSGRVWVYDPFGGRASARRSRRWSRRGAGRARSAPAKRSPPPRTPTRRTPRTSSGTRRRRACSRRCCTPPRSTGADMSELVRWLDARDFTRRDRRPEGRGRARRRPTSSRASAAATSETARRPS